MKKVFTVVIPMYNAEDTIADAINSVCSQTRADLVEEIIIIDDGSTDGSYEIVKQISENSSIFINLKKQKNAGVSSARNKGLCKVRTDWIALLDSDDMWEKEKIRKQYDLLCNNKDIDFLGGNINEKAFNIYGRELPYLYKASVKDICLRNFPQPSTAIFKTNIFLEIGGFDIKQNYAEDQKYFLKICKNYNFYHVQEKLINYGNGKRAFGESGLSSNLKEMHKGNLRNLRQQYKEKNISLTFYVFLTIFNNLKYVRRKLITALN